MALVNMAFRLAAKVIHSYINSDSIVWYDNHSYHEYLDNFDKSYLVMSLNCNNISIVPS